MTDVRFAERSDIPALVDLARDMHVESRYGWMVFTADRVWKRLDAMIDRKDTCVMLAGPVTEPNGFLLGRVEEYAFARDFVGHLDFLYVRPARRGGMAAMKMLSAFFRWARNRNVAEIAVCNTFGSNETHTRKVFAKLGLGVVGATHAMWIEERK